MSRSGKGERGLGSSVALSQPSTAWLLARLPYAAHACQIRPFSACARYALCDPCDWLFEPHAAASCITSTASDPLRNGMSGRMHEEEVLCMHEPVRWLHVVGRGAATLGCWLKQGRRVKQAHRLLHQLRQNWPCRRSQRD